MDDAALCRYASQPLISRHSPATIRAAWWTVRALRRARSSLRRDGVRATVPAPPQLPPGARRGVEAVLRRQSPTCLERAVVLQRWLAAHAVDTDVVVGVRREGSGTTAHAWLDVDGAPAGEGFVELHRLGPP